MVLALLVSSLQTLNGLQRLLKTDLKTLSLVFAVTQVASTSHHQRVTQTHKTFLIQWDFLVVLLTLKQCSQRSIRLNLLRNRRKSQLSVAVSAVWKLLWFVHSVATQLTFMKRVTNSVVCLLLLQLHHIKKKTVTLLHGIIAKSLVMMPSQFI